MGDGIADFFEGRQLRRFILLIDLFFCQTLEKRHLPVSFPSVWERPKKKDLVVFLRAFRPRIILFLKGRYFKGFGIPSGGSCGEAEVLRETLGCDSMRYIKRCRL